MKHSLLTSLGKFTALALLLCIPLCTYSQKDTTGVKLKEVNVKATKLIFVNKKDTVVYDIDALMVSKNDMLRDIIKKMPGLELRDGVLYFHGKKVSRLQVNGTDFMRGDTRKALDNLPAYIIKHIKAYESLTEHARITGIDDGTRDQVVNVILRREYMGTWTGNADAAYGTDSYYRLRAFANTFTDRMRISLYGGFTNTGQSQSAGSDGQWQDNGGVGSSSGETTFKRPGFTMMWKNKKKQNETGFFQIESGGGWSYIGHRDFGIQESERFNDDGTSSYSMSDSRTRDDSNEYGAYAFMQWMPTKTTFLQFSINYGLTKQDNIRNDRYGLWDTPVTEHYTSPLDSLFATEQAWPDNSAVLAQKTLNGSDGKRNGTNISLWATQKLTPNNWRLTLNHSSKFQKNDRTANSLAHYRYFRESAQDRDPLINRYTDNSSRSNNHNTQTELNIPIKHIQALTIIYRHNVSSDKNDNAGFRLEKLGGIFADFNSYADRFGLLPTDDGWQLLARDAEVTLNSHTTNNNDNISANITTKPGKLFAKLSGGISFAHDKIDYRKGDYDPLRLSRHTKSYEIKTTLRLKPDDKGTNYELDYSFQTSPHALSNSITIPDQSDPLNISLGNPNMKDRRTHSVGFYSNRNINKGRNFNVTLNWRNTANTSTMSRTYNKETGVTTSQPTTISGDWTAGGGIGFSGRIDQKQKFTFNSGLSYYFFHIPAYTLATQGTPQKRTDEMQRIRANASINMRHKKLFASVGVNTSLEHTRSTESFNRTLYSQHTNYSASLQYTLPLDIEMSTNINVSHITGSRARYYDPVRTIWNAQLTRSFLRNKSLSVQLELSDILNQRSQRGAWVDGSSRSSIYAHTVGRFAMAHLIYHFTTKKETKK